MNRLTTPRLLASLLPLALAACAHAPPPAGDDAAAPPAAAETVAADWRAQTIYTGTVGVWYAYVDDVIDELGSREVVATDDDGRFLVLSVYSGNWTVRECIPDRQWLAPSRPADVDPAVPGPELYAAGRAGSIHQITLRRQPYALHLLESRELGHVAGEEFHTVLAGDLSDEPGDELLVFGITGAVYLLRPPSDAGGGLVMLQVADAKGRVRDAIATRLPGRDGVTVLGTSRRGDLLAMRLAGAGLEVQSVLRENEGLGRIAAGALPGVYYVTRDDGVLLRVAFAADGAVERAPILATDQGLRGVAAGRFFADGREAVAVCGYNGKVQLVSRVAGGPWTVADVYAGAQKCHWLARGELDGRNATDELVVTGFDGEMVLLSRPKGYGLEGVAVPAESR